VGFALETDDQRFRALTKLIKKSCDLIVLNGPAAIDAVDNQVEVLDASGAVVASASGSKADVAREILRVIEQHLVARRS
jgi:phosphopantothenoylcysteine decarboxylase/phosphopantothenate--cysteine ligase